MRLWRFASPLADLGLVEKVGPPSRKLKFDDMLGDSTGLPDNICILRPTTVFSHMWL
jgi:hypothetical protein